MIDKSVLMLSEVIVGIYDGVIIMIGGFGFVGQLIFLIDVLIDQGVCDLIIINNNVGNGEVGFVVLFKVGWVCKMICFFLCQVDLQIFDDFYCCGKVELELVLQGNFVVWIQVVGVGLGVVFIFIGYGMLLVEGKEIWEIDGCYYVLEYLIKVDFVLIKVYQGDCWGNLVYCKVVCNFGLIMVIVVKIIIVEVLQLVVLGDFDLENIIIFGIFVQCVFLLENLIVV